MHAQNQGKMEAGFFQNLLDFIGDGKVALFQAYFDESKRNGNLCVAGYVFGPENARKLAHAFRKCFEPYGGFHMVDLCAKAQKYAGISDEERIRLIKEAVRVVRMRFRYGVAVTVDQEEYETLAPKNVRGMKGAYPFLCHLAVFATADLVRSHSEKGPIHYVFEAGHAQEKEARVTLENIATDPELKAYCMHSGDSFLPKADAVPMQAADLLAWEIGKFKNETVDEPIRRMRLSLQELVEDDPNRYSIHFVSNELLARNIAKYRALGLFS